MLGEAADGSGPREGHHRERLFAVGRFHAWGAQGHPRKGEARHGRAFLQQPFHIGSRDVTLKGKTSDFGGVARGQAGGDPQASLDHGDIGHHDIAHGEAIGAHVLHPALAAPAAGGSIGGDRHQGWSTGACRERPAP